MLNTVCELRSTFRDLDTPGYANFNARNWLVAVSFTPKIDRDLNAGVGATRKATVDSNPVHILSWALGSVGSPGAQIDAKGTRNAGATLTIKSVDLIDTGNNYPLTCPPATLFAHALSQNMGIGDWIKQNVYTSNTVLAGIGKFDKPTFSSEIFVKFSANGNLTYAFKPGTDFAAASGYYDLDETLSISLTKAESAKLVVQTLPSGGRFGAPQKSVLVVQSPYSAEQRLDALQSQQQLLNALKNIPSSQ